MNIDRKIDGFVGCYLKRWDLYWDEDQMSPLIDDAVVSKVENPVDSVVGFREFRIEKLLWND